MRIIKTLLMALAIVPGCGVLAWSCAFVLAKAGALGSCVEAACAYTAVLLVLPALWIVFSASALLLWQRRRRR